MPRLALNAVEVPTFPIHTGPEVLRQRSHLAVYVAQAITGWTRVELALAQTAAKLWRQSFDKVIDGFLSQSLSGQFDLLRELADIEFLPEDYELLCATLPFIEEMKRVRNEMAQGIWGIVDALPFALILMEPRLFMQINLMDWCQWPSRETDLNGHYAGLQKAQRASSFVYHEADLAEIVQDMVAAATCAECLGGLYLRHHMSCDEPRARLMNHPAIRKTLSELQASGEPPTGGIRQL